MNFYTWLSKTETTFTVLLPLAFSLYAICNELIRRSSNTLYYKLFLTSIPLSVITTTWIKSSNEFGLHIFPMFFILSLVYALRKKDKYVAPTTFVAFCYLNVLIVDVLCAIYPKVVPNFVPSLFSEIMPSKAMEDLFNSHPGLAIYGIGGDGFKDLLFLIPVIATIYVFVLGFKENKNAILDF